MTTKPRFGFALDDVPDVAAVKGVSVDAAEAAIRELSQKADVCLPLKEVPFGKVFGLNDPASRPRYLVEFAKDRPSRPVR